MIYITYGDIPETDQEAKSETTHTGTLGETDSRCCKQKINEERR